MLIENVSGGLREVNDGGLEKGGTPLSSVVEHDAQAGRLGVIKLGIGQSRICIFVMYLQGHLGESGG